MGSGHLTSLRTVQKVLTRQEGGADCRTQWCVLVIPAMGMWKVVSWSLLPGQPHLIGEPQVPRRDPASKIKVRN